MRNNISQRVLSFGVVLLTIAIANTAHANHDYRLDTYNATNQLTSHHGMNLLGDEVNDLGMGPLQTFVVQPGETATFLFDVYEDDYDYYLGGRTVHEDGILHGSTPDFTAILEDTYWKYRPWAFYTIMLDDMYSGPHVFVYEMEVGNDTPADFYLMEAVLVGMDEGEDSGREIAWYQIEKFYVEVRSIPEPSSMTLLVTLGVGSLLLPILQRRKRNCETALDRRREQRPDARRCRGIRGWPWLRNKKKIPIFQKQCHTKTADKQGTNGYPSRTEMRKERAENKSIE